MLPGMQNTGDDTRSVLDEAASLVRAGDTRAGKARIEWVLEREPDNALAWLWMSKCLTDKREILNCYHRVLSIEPGNAHAEEGLRRFGGRPAIVSQPMPSPSSSAAQQPPATLPGAGPQRWRFPLLLGLPIMALAIALVPLVLLPGDLFNQSEEPEPPESSSLLVAPCDLSAAIAFETFLIDRETALIDQLHQVMQSPDGYSLDSLDAFYRQALAYRLIQDGPAVPACFETILSDSLAHSRRAADHWVEAIVAIGQDDLARAEGHYTSGLDEAGEAGDSFGEVVCRYDLSENGSAFAGVCRIRQHLTGP